MQCLFCGKELALLKRLRGGAEFCSEAHRKDYQEQFEQLALARLIQAKPPSGPVAPLGRTPVVPDFASAPDLNGASDSAPDTAIYDAEVPAPAWAEPQALPSSVSSREQPAEDPSPAPLAGFLREPMVPAVTPFQCAGVLELDNEMAAMSLPAADWTVSAAAEPFSAPAPPVEIVVSLQALEHHTRTSERGMELREFPGASPVMELHLRPDSGTEPAGADDVMEILMSPHPPQTAKFWLGAPRGFSAPPAELGDLARLDFTTTGFAHSDGPVAASSAQVADSQTAVLTPELPAHLEPAPEAPVAQAPVVQTPVVQAPIEPAPPELVTRVLPVTLHGLSAPRGKFTETFASGIAAASGVQIPASATLPLRPMIVFGPAPAPARPPEAVASPVRPSPVPVPSQPAQPRQVQPKQVQPQQVPLKPVPEKAVEAKTEVRSSVVPAPKPVPVKRPVAPVAPVVQPRVNPTVNPRAESPVEPRRNAVAPSEAALPTLHLETESSAWSKLSTGVKIGVAAALIVGLSGIAYLVTKGNGKPADSAPVATVAAPAVATGVAISGGWIDDWASFAKSRRHISVLSGSTKLSDYRLEFQSQIESKAIGWVARAQNPRNYYVTKLEIVKPGLEPTVALVHFAVVDGQDENRVVVPLPMKVRVDTTYKIRFDAFGNRFTAWVQGEKIAEWTDSRFGSGGIGFFSERDEHAALQGTVNVVALVPKN